VRCARRPLVNAWPGLKTRAQQAGRLNGASRCLSLFNPQSAIISSPYRRRLNDTAFKRGALLPFAVQSAIHNPQSAIISSPYRRRLNDTAFKRGALLPFAVQSAIRNPQSAIISSPYRRRLNDTAFKRGALLPFAVQSAIHNSQSAIETRGRLRLPANPSYAVQEIPAAFSGRNPAGRPCGAGSGAKRRCSHDLGY
jgi:hypothetical protein